jgi:oxygen-independent coproporphyrinogen-3 oxidase
LRNPIPEKRYVDALLSDLEQELPRIWGRRIEAVFIGGGTPSLFSAEAIDQLLAGMHARLALRPGAEITLEANPGSAEQGKFHEFRAAGVNRLSIGAQSFDDECLRRLGRIHSAHEARLAAEAAHAAGFDNFNIDLMFGLPGQDPGTCHNDLRSAIDLAPTHVSFYQLTIEPNTWFNHRPPPLPDEDAIWEMQTSGQTLLADHGYTQYEVSAYAKVGQQCRHNMNYWQFGDYVGIGAGAHGKLSCAATHAISRRWKHPHPRQYMQGAVDGHTVGGARSLNAEDAAFEFMLNALRLTAGFDARLFSERTGLPLSVLEPRLTELVDRELLWRQGGKIGPTCLGQRFLNDVMAHFLNGDDRAH